MKTLERLAASLARNKGPIVNALRTSKEPGIAIAAESDFGAWTRNVARAISERDQLLEAATFALSVLKANGLHEMSETLAAGKLTTAIRKATE